MLIQTLKICLRVTDLRYVTRSFITFPPHFRITRQVTSSIFINNVTLFSKCLILPHVIQSQFRGHLCLSRFLKICEFLSNLMSKKMWVRACATQMWNSRGCGWRDQKIPFWCHMLYGPHSVLSFLTIKFALLHFLSVKRLWNVNIFIQNANGKFSIRIKI